MKRKSGKDQYLLIYENESREVVACIDLNGFNGYLKKGYTVQIANGTDEIIKKLGPDAYMVPDSVAIKK